MKKLLMILALTLPLMAQEAESKDDTKQEAVVKQECKYCDKGKMKRGDMQRRMGMQRANQERKKIHKKQQIRQVVRLVVVGGLAYYIGYHQGEKHFNGGWDRRKDWDDRK